MRKTVVSQRRTWIALGAVTLLVALASAAAVYTDLNARQLNRTGILNGSSAVMVSPSGSKATAALGEVGGGFSSNPAGVYLEGGHTPYIAGAPPAAITDWETLQQK